MFPQKAKPNKGILTGGLALFFCLFSNLALASLPQNSFLGEYWNLPSTSGAAPSFPTTTPTKTRTDSTINFNWGTNPPVSGINSDDFAVRWQGSWNFATTGYYEFKVTADDGIRLYLDGTLLINQWKDQGPTTYTAKANITAGVHTIKVEYYENSSGAVAQVTWQPLSALIVPVTATANQTSSTSSRWNLTGTEKYSYNADEWLEYLLDFGTGSSWVFSLTAINYGGGLPSGYSFNIAVTVDGASKGSFSVPGSTTTYKTGSLPGLALSGIHTVRFTWTNDAYQPGVYDANIRVKEVSFLSEGGDTTPPQGIIKINNDAVYTNSTSVTLNLSATDTGSGLSQMQFSNDNLTWSSPEAYTTSKPWTLTSGDSTKTVYVKYKDAAGNWSNPFSDAIILDTVPPEVIITSPLNGAVIEDSQVQLQGTIDGAAFSETRSLNSGENTLTKTTTDPAGNTSFASVTVNPYLGELIGEEGGVVYSSDGKIKVVIPPGALNEPQRIRVLSVSKEALESATPKGTILLSVVECKPYGLIFNKPVQIIYTLEQAEIPGTAVELGFYDSIQKKIISSNQTSTVPVDGYTVTFSIMHFSTYAALKNLTPQSAPIGGGVKIPLPDMLTGAFSSSIPITTPPGRKGMQPSLGLSYRSSSTNSWVGLGFSLNPGYIVRSTRLGPPTYIDTQDTFYLITEAGTTELVHLIDNLYQAKIESNFTKFFKETDDSWKVVGKDGSALRFGQTPDSKETSSSGTFSWHITKAIDTNGNYIEYRYLKDQGKSYLSRIDYTGSEIGASPTNSVEFTLEARDDVYSSYISTAKVATSMRLKEIQVKVNGGLVWRYELEYNYSSDTNRSLLKSVKQYGADNKSLPAQTFTYQQAK